MDAEFCVEALKEAIVTYGKPEIMNSDQGSQFTGFDWIQALKDANVKISMDGRGPPVSGLLPAALLFSIFQVGGIG